MASSLEIVPGQIARRRRSARLRQEHASPSSCAASTTPSGRLLLDDLDLRLWSPAVLRQQIGVVPQEVQLFSGTIAENIAMGAIDRHSSGSSRPPSSSARTTSSSACRRATTPARRARQRPVGRPAPADQHRPRADPQPAPSWSSTRPPARSTARPSRRCWPISTRLARPDRRHGDPSPGRARDRRPGACSWSTAGSSARAGRARSRPRAAAARRPPRPGSRPRLGRC